MIGGCTDKRPRQICAIQRACPYRPPPFSQDDLKRACFGRPFERTPEGARIGGASPPPGLAASDTAPRRRTTPVATIGGGPAGGRGCAAARHPSGRSSSDDGASLLSLNSSSDEENTSEARRLLFRAGAAAAAAAAAAPPAPSGWNVRLSARWPRSPHKRHARARPPSPEGSSSSSAASAACPALWPRGAAGRAAGGCCSSRAAAPAPLGGPPPLPPAWRRGSVALPRGSGRVPPGAAGASRMAFPRRASSTRSHSVKPGASLAAAEIPRKSDCSRAKRSALSRDGRVATGRVATGRWRRRPPPPRPSLAQQRARARTPRACAPASHEACRSPRPEMQLAEWQARHAARLTDHCQRWRCARSPLPPTRLP